MDGNGDLVTDCHSILASWRSFFSQQFNAPGFNNVRQTEIRTAEPLLTESNAFEFKMAIENLKRHKFSVIHQISAELINVGCRTIRYKIHKLINPICNNE
jgi:hypothetical protein